jgi:lysophospholipase L1-like esterase
MNQNCFDALTHALARGTSCRQALNRLGGRLLTALLVLTCGIAQAPAAHASAPQSQHDYLALGASYAFGFQQAKFLAELQAGTYSAASFNTGYVDDFARMLAAGKSRLQTVNLSCPGETSDSFISGGCPFHLSGLSLHDDYPASSSQMAAALAFLYSHPHQVHVITISLTDLSGNALAKLYFNTCAQDPTCTLNAFPAFLAHEQANANQILSALQAASPSSQILVLQEFNARMLLLPASVPLFDQMNAMLERVAATHGAALADGVSPATPSNICTLTFVCTPPLYDIHPTDAGYAVLAQALWAAYDN